MFLKSNITWLVVFLGNPGPKYDNTRHNAGFRAADTFAKANNFHMDRLKFHALTGDVLCGGERVLAMKPQTYMNLSGNAVREAAAFYKIPPDHVLVICDDVTAQPGHIRLRRKGSAGGHNGLKSIIQQLGTDQFPRIKLGVGAKPHPDYDLVDWVLGKFSPADSKRMDEAAEQTAQAIEVLLREGFDKASNRFSK